MSEQELSLLCMPMPLGIDGSMGFASARHSPSHPSQLHPSQLKEGGALTSPEDIVDRAPNVTITGARIDQLHLQFSVLGLERTYVLFVGQLAGVIRRSELGGR